MGATVLYINWRSVIKPPSQGDTVVMLACVVVLKRREFIGGSVHNTTPILLHKHRNHPKYTIAYSAALNANGLSSSVISHSFPPRLAM